MPDDPLERLADLHLPDAVGWWPPAPGWWMLAALLLLSPLLWLAWKRWTQRLRVPVYRRAALRELEQEYQQYLRHENGPVFVQSASALLKRVALQCYDPRQVASLSGEQWGEFLGRGQSPDRQQQIKLILEHAHSRELQADIAGFYHFAREWIEAQEKF